MFLSMTCRLVTGGTTAPKRAPLGNADVLLGALDVTFSIFADEDVRVPREVEA